MLPYCHMTVTLVVKEVARCYFTVIWQRHLWSRRWSSATLLLYDRYTCGQGGGQLLPYFLKTETCGQGGGQVLPYFHKTDTRCQGGGQVLPYFHKTETLVVKEVDRCYLTDMIYRDTCGEGGGQGLPYFHKTETLVVKEVARCYLTVIRQRHLWSRRWPGATSLT